MGNLTSDVLALGLLRYIVFLFSTTCHEAAHALAGKLGGDETAFRGGQVTLNPLPHIQREPFGMVVVPLLSLLSGGGMIGWASAPYDPLWARREPRKAAWMSLAGPAANFTLVVLGALLMIAGVRAGVFRPAQSISTSHLVLAAQPGPMEGVATLLSVVFTLNLLLGIFNLLPVPPLDGFSAVGLLMPGSLIEMWTRVGDSIRRFSFLGLLLVWQVFPNIYGPVLLAGLKMLYSAF